ncbi:hypothetical protein [Flavobacterium sp.]|uniref:hypothetical protein n=1 Tax=Flavobacterium sp. TaxID=239 RepID=UPI003753B0D9
MSIKGLFSSSALVNLTFASGTVKIPFNSTDFDTNAEFNSSTNTFTAKQEGIYRITTQIKANSSIAIATNFGIAALKNGTVFARNSFANIGVLGVNITPPIRAINTLISLNANDTISFSLVSDLASVSILGTSEDCFFTIEQIR